MNTELGWLSTEFTRSLLLSAPAETVPAWISAAYQWLFVDSGMQTWLHAQQAGTAAGRSVSEFSSELSQWLAYHLHDYLLATVYVTVVTMVRVVILVLSVPWFVMVVLVAVVEGWGAVICGVTARLMSPALSIIMQKNQSDRRFMSPALFTFPGPARYIRTC